MIVNASFLLVFVTGFGLDRAKISSIAVLEFEVTDDGDGRIEASLVGKREVITSCI